MKEKPRKALEASLSERHNLQFVSSVIMSRRDEIKLVYLNST